MTTIRPLLYAVSIATIVGGLVTLGAWASTPTAPSGNDPGCPNTSTKRGVYAPCVGYLPTGATSPAQARGVHHLSSIPGVLLPSLTPAQAAQKGLLPGNLGTPSFGLLATVSLAGGAGQQNPLPKPVTSPPYCVPPFSGPSPQQLPFQWTGWDAGGLYANPTQFNPPAPGWVGGQYDMSTVNGCSCTESYDYTYQYQCGSYCAATDSNGNCTDWEPSYCTGYGTCQKVYYQPHQIPINAYTIGSESVPSDFDGCASAPWGATFTLTSPPCVPQNSGGNNASGWATMGVLNGGCAYGAGITICGNPNNNTLTIMMAMVSSDHTGWIPFTVTVPYTPGQSLNLAWSGQDILVNGKSVPVQVQGKTLPNLSSFGDYGNNVDTSMSLNLQSGTLEFNNASTLQTVGKVWTTGVNLNTGKQYTTLSQQETLEANIAANNNAYSSNPQAAAQANSNTQGLSTNGVSGSSPIDTGTGNNVNFGSGHIDNVVSPGGTATGGNAVQTGGSATGVGGGGK